MKIFIDSIKAARREMAKTYNEYKTGAIKSDEAKTRIYILRSISESCFRYEIEERLVALERSYGVNNEFNE